MKKWHMVGLVIVMVLIAGIVIAEQMTFSTYYPAPYGVYNEMRARRMAVGGNYLDSAANPVADNNLIVAGRVGIGTTEPKGDLQIGEWSIITDAADDTHLSNNAYFDGRDWRYIRDGYATMMGMGNDTTTNGGIGFLTAPAGGKDVAIGWSTSKSKMFIANDGRVGIGTVTPSRSLHIASTADGSSGIRISSDVASYDIYRQASGALGGFFIFEGSQANHVGYIFTGVDGEWMRITKTGNVGIGTIDPKGALDVNGAIYQRGASLHADYVFEPSYDLEPIEEHAEYMWQNKSLKAIPRAKLDEDGQQVLEIGVHRRGLLEELEKAHIYIEQLDKRVKMLESKLK